METITYKNKGKGILLQGCPSADITDNFLPEMAAMGSKSMQKAIIPEFRGIYVDQIANQVC